MAHGIQRKNFQILCQISKPCPWIPGKYLVGNATKENKSVTCVEMNGNNGSTINLSWSLDSQLRIHWARNAYYFFPRHSKPF